MEMQKSPVFCVAHAGSCRPELFLFGHLGSSPQNLLTAWAITPSMGLLHPDLPKCTTVKSATVSQPQPARGHGCPRVGVSAGQRKVPVLSKGHDHEQESFLQPGHSWGGHSWDPSTANILAGGESLPQL
ncbi:hypothetical protein CR201_G0051262 [Pongo abelii]|uniref:Uncharacterized protein n=1 Tax=Pongo abelii TaxID=9601 RepID=A0A2J8RFS0_PONAB|nr:hypothetical protein CR201_G0051262 [Pongo abelii]